MKKKIIFGSLVGLLVLGSVGVAETFLGDFLKFGQNTAGDRTIEFNIGAGANNPKIRWDNSESQIQIAENGTTFFAVNKAPTITRFLSGSGTFNPPAGAKYLIVTVQGGGGGGSGSGTSNTAGNGGIGGTSSFESVSAAGGTGGIFGDNGSTSGNGGAVSVSGATSIVALNGAPGSDASTSYWSTGGTPTANFSGGVGGISPFGGAGGTKTGGLNAVANSGSGGSGAPGQQTANFEAGAGGGAGAHARVLYPGPLAASYSYAVGAAGTAGTAGTSGGVGGIGGSGIVIVEVYY